MCANKTKDAIEEEARRAHRPIQMAIFDIFARFTSALLPSSSFNGPVSCFHYYHFLSISLWMLAVWLDFFFYFSSSFERFYKLYNFFSRSVVVFSFFLSWRQMLQLMRTNIHSREKELSGAESITCPKLYTASIKVWVSQWVSESTWLHYSY